MKFELWIDRKDFDDLQKRYYGGDEDIVLRRVDIGGCVKVLVTLTRRTNSKPERKKK